MDNNAPAKSSEVVAKDALSDFVNKMADPFGFSGGYRDGPFVGYAKDSLGKAYGGSWIARAAIEVIPEDCFKRAYQWVGDGDQISKIEEVERIHDIKQKKRRAMVLSRLDGEAYIYIDTGDDPSRELVPERVGLGRFRFANVLRMRDVTTGENDTDPISKYYGQPSYYQINSPTGQVNIHPSRICRFIGAEDMESGRGVSVLTYMLAPIVAAETARDNVVALTTEARIDVMSVCGLADAVSTPEGAAQMAARYSMVRQMKATNRMMVLDKDGEDYQQKQSSFATLPDVIETMRREVAAAIGIPYSLLFGRPQGLGTNGDVELKNYYDNIATMQKNIIQPACQVLDEVIVRSALGGNPDEVYLDWLSLYEMSDREKADVAKVYADAAGVAVEKGIVPADVLTSSLINSWVEIGAFQGIESDYDDWVAGGGTLDEPDDESDVLRGGGNDDTVDA